MRYIIDIFNREEIIDKMDDELIEGEFSKYKRLVDNNCAEIMKVEGNAISVYSDGVWKYSSIEHVTNH